MKRTGESGKIPCTQVVQKNIEARAPALCDKGAGPKSGDDLSATRGKMNGESVLR